MEKVGGMIVDMRWEKKLALTILLFFLMSYYDPKSRPFNNYVPIEIGSISALFLLLSYCQVF